MIPNNSFRNQPKSFWAYVRTISQKVGYTARNQSQIKIPTISQMKEALHQIGLDTSHIVDKNNHPTTLGNALSDYFKYRADILNNYVEPRLMDVEKAKKVFNGLRKKVSPKCPLPMNKQKEEKKAHAYFTGIINILIEANSKRFSCDYAPGALTTITRNSTPLRTLARRVDGAFPSIVNPIAIWEIKEYYYTTTFGSRVADGIYETLLDGMEIEELREHEGINVKHYLMIDAYYTWWKMGRSYLCRIIDMLHMGYVDEVLFGYEAVERLPEIVKEWTKLAAQ